MAHSVKPLRFIKNWAVCKRTILVNYDDGYSWIWRLEACKYFGNGRSDVLYVYSCRKFHCNSQYYFTKALTI